MSASRSVIDASTVLRRFAQARSNRRVKRKISQWFSLLYKRWNQFHGIRHVTVRASAQTPRTASEQGNRSRFRRRSIIIRQNNPERARNAEDEQQEEKG